MFKFNTIKKALIFSFISFVFSASQSNAIELDEATRTIALDGSGKTFVLSAEQVKRGNRLSILPVPLATAEDLLKRLGPLH